MGLVSVVATSYLGCYGSVASRHHTCMPTLHRLAPPCRVPCPASSRKLACAPSSPCPRCCPLPFNRLTVCTCVHPTSACARRHHAVRGAGGGPGPRLHHRHPPDLWGAHTPSHVLVPGLQRQGPHSMGGRPASLRPATASGGSRIAAITGGSSCGADVSLIPPAPLPPPPCMCSPGECNSLGWPNVA
jgi:hypothetical protein